MKEKDISQEDKDRYNNLEVRFIDRIVFRERPVILMVDRAVQSEEVEVNLRAVKESKDAQT
jgi:hypothetical protein